MEQIKEVAIIGVGLIGGSIGLALKKYLPSVVVTGIGRNIDRLKLAQQKGCIDKFTTELKDGVKNADIIIVCVPVELTAKFIISLLPYVKENAVITDVASVKNEIIKKVKEKLLVIRKKKNINFVGSHPLAGLEKSGFEYAKEDLFKDSVCVICYDKTICSKKALEKIKFLWKTIKANLVELEPKKHDKILALTSHMLHVISYILAKQINSKKEYLKFTAGAYRDMTRIAASNPEMWTQICYTNKEAVKNSLKEFITLANKVLEYLDNYKKLKKFLTSAYKLKIKSYEQNKNI
jgi:prephenate dehydrogenase